MTDFSCGCKIDEGSGVEIMICQYHTRHPWVKQLVMYLRSALVDLAYRDPPNDEVREDK